MLYKVYVVIKRYWALWVVCLWDELSVCVYAAYSEPCFEFVESRRLLLFTMLWKIWSASFVRKLAAAQQRLVPTAKTKHHTAPIIHALVVGSQPFTFDFQRVMSHGSYVKKYCGS